MQATCCFCGTGKAQFWAKRISQTPVAMRKIMVIGPISLKIPMKRHVTISRSGPICPVCLFRQLEQVKERSKVSLQVALLDDLLGAQVRLGQVELFDRQPLAA